MVSKKQSRKGFKRSQEEWEESIATHIGKFFDNLKLDDFITLLVGGWAGYATEDPVNILTGMIGYKLARTDGIPSQVVGLGMLGFLGLAAIPEAFREEYLEQTAPHWPDWWPFKSQERKNMFIP